MAIRRRWCAITPQFALFFCKYKGTGPNLLGTPDFLRCFRPFTSHNIARPNIDMLPRSTPHTIPSPVNKLIGAGGST